MVISDSEFIDNPYAARRTRLEKVMLKVALVFSLILIAIRKKIAMGHAFVTGAVLLGFLFQMPVARVFGSVLTAVTAPETVSLALVVALIFALGKGMEISGQMRRLLDKYRGLIRNPKINLVVLPALIGLLPVPGGAVFSAPMVKELGGRVAVSGNLLSYANYWFRHVWEYFWPLYSIVLLTVAMANINMLFFISVMWPLSAVAVVVGFFPLRGADLGDSAEAERPAVGPFLQEMMPILIAIVFGITLGAILTRVFPEYPIGRETGMGLALSAGVIWVFVVNRMSKKDAVAIGRAPQLYRIIYMVFAILLFKEMLGKSGAVETVSGQLLSLNIPMLLITALLPFAVAMVTGLAMAFVGSTFPILIPLIQSAGESEHLLAYLMVALVVGFGGILLSPLHLCMVLSNEYFEASTAAVYRHLWKPAVLLMMSAGAYFPVLYWLCGRFGA